MAERIIHNFGCRFPEEPCDPACRVVIRDTEAMMYGRRVRLVKPYERDMELWVTYPADPKFVTLDPGEVITCSNDEANQLIREGVAAEAQTCFLVIEQPSYEITRIVGVFSTRDLADAAAGRLKHAWVEEFIVDEDLGGNDE